MELQSTAAPLARALQRAGLDVAASHLITIVSRPNSSDIRPTSRIRNARRLCRRWLDGSSDNEIEEALAELIVAALTEPEPALLDHSRPLIEMRRRIAGSNSQ